MSARYTRSPQMNHPSRMERQEGVTTAGAPPSPAHGGDRREDRILVDAVAGGDRAALRTLYERHAPWLFVRLSRRCADRGIVEDVVQETFVAVWRRADRYRASGEVAAWIWGIGIRRLIDRLRQR